MPQLPTVLTELDLPPAELNSMRLDGELYALADGWCAIDELESPSHRAAAVRGLRSPRLIAELGTAAWIWGATPALPRLVEFCVDLDARARLPVSPLVRVRELVLDGGDRIDLDGSAVTSPVRTAVDLARFREELTDDERAVIVELARIGAFGLAECRELLERRQKLPEKRRATARLSELLAQPEFTR